MGGAARWSAVKATDVEGQSEVAVGLCWLVVCRVCDEGQEVRLRCSRSIRVQLDLVCAVALVGVARCGLPNFPDARALHQHTAPVHSEGGGRATLVNEACALRVRAGTQALRNTVLVPLSCLRTARHYSALRALMCCPPASVATERPSERRRHRAQAGVEACGLVCVCAAGYNANE